jgi:SAM-dependent methyltransferase
MQLGESRVPVRFAWLFSAGFLPHQPRQRKQLQHRLGVLAKKVMNICLFNPGIEDNRGTLSSNLGDLLIEKAVRRELSMFSGDARIFSISTQAYPQFKQLSRIVRSQLRLVGGTNLLSSNMARYSQWKITPWQAFAIKNAILIGVGWWQYQDDPDPYTRRLLRRCLSSQWVHSVRDSYTLQKMRAMGIDNVINTGCPTMWPLANATSDEFPRQKADAVLLMLTDYVSLYTKPELDARLVELLLERYRTVYYWPQGRADRGLVGPWSGRLKILDPTVAALFELVNGPEPFDYVGTRLHGGVTCLLARRRSLILEVDNRAAEIAKDTNLPTCARDDFESIARWIDGPSDTSITMDITAIDRWRNQFTAESLRRGRPAAAKSAQPARMFTTQPGKPLMVNLGCGSTFDPNWINMDFIPASPAVITYDLRKRLPFDSNTCDVVYAAHVLEHFSRAMAQTFIRECYRVLRPGGVLRIVVPDLEMITRLYLRYLEGAVAGEPQAVARHEWMTLELLDQLTRERTGGEVMRYWMQHPMPAEEFVVERTGVEVRRFLAANRQKPGYSPPVQPELTAEPSPKEIAKFRATGETHKWMYDRFSLQRLLNQTGLTHITHCSAGESAIAGFVDFALDTDPDGAIRKPDSLYMEGVKP